MPGMLCLLNTLYFLWDWILLRWFPPLAKCVAFKLYYLDMGVYPFISIHPSIFIYTCHLPRHPTSFGHGHHAPPGNPQEALEQAKAGFKTPGPWWSLVELWQLRLLDFWWIFLWISSTLWEKHRHLRFQNSLKPLDGTGYPIFDKPWCIFKFGM